MNKSDTITIDGVQYIRADSVQQVATVEGTPIGQYCIVRCRDAGVWAGVVQDKQGRDATLLNARRLWYWKVVKGHTLSAVANYGIKEGKLPAPVAVAYLTETCEFLPCTQAAKATIENIGAHNE